MSTADSPQWPRDSPTPALRLGIPRDFAHTPVARTAAGSFGATAGLSVDAVADLRLAVHEAAVLLADLAQAEVQVELRQMAAGVDVEVSAPAAPGSEVDDTDFGWLILSESTSGLEWRAAHGRLIIAFTVIEGGGGR